VLEAKAEGKWVRRTSGPASDGSAGPTRTFGVVTAGPAVGGASSNRTARRAALGVACALPALPRAETHRDAGPTRTFARGVALQVAADTILALSRRLRAARPGTIGRAEA